MPDLTEVEARVLATFDEIANHRRLTDQEIAKVAGLTQQAVSAKRRGHRKIRVADLDWIAKALGVEVDVLFLGPSAGLRWVLDHSPNQREAGYVTLALTAAVVGVAALTRVPPEVAAGIAQAIAENRCDDDVMSGDVEITLPLAA